MRPTTTTALALAGTALALPAGAALAETNDDPPSPARTALAAPFAGHLSIDAQMRAERREVLVERLTPRIVRTERRTARVTGPRLPPPAASPAEQDRRAALLYAQQGSSPWPVCGG